MFASHLENKFASCSCSFRFLIHFSHAFAHIGVIILSAIANRFRLSKLSRVDQFVMSYGGLRGAVAFALALLIKQQRVDSQPMFVTTTIAVIYFTVFLQGTVLCGSSVRQFRLLDFIIFFIDFLVFLPGITIKPLVKFLNVKRANKKKPSMNERIHERVSSPSFIEQKGQHSDCSAFLIFVLLRSKLHHHHHCSRP